MASTAPEPEFPCSLTLHIPFPTPRLASIARGSLEVDQELSSLVQRTFSVVAPTTTTTTSTAEVSHSSPGKAEPSSGVDEPSSSSSASSSSSSSVLRVDYRATTNRMLRVAVNGFFDSLKVIVQVMEELDADVLHAKGGVEGLEGVQGVEQGLTGTGFAGGAAAVVAV